MFFLITISAVSVVYILSSLLGASSITVAQWQYLRARADGRIDEGERAHLNTLFFSLRYALVIMVIAQIILGLLLFMTPHVFTIQFITTYLFEFSIAVVLVITSWLRFHGRIPFWAGSAIPFVGWWYLVEINLGYITVINAGFAFTGFIINVVLVAALFAGAHYLVDNFIHHA